MACSVMDSVLASELLIRNFSPRGTTSVLSLFPRSGDDVLASALLEKDIITVKAGKLEVRLYVVVACLWVLAL